MRRVGCFNVVREYPRRRRHIIIVVVSMVMIGLMVVIVVVMQINKDYFEKMIVVGQRWHHHLAHSGLFRESNAATIAVAAIASIMESDEKICYSFGSAASSRLHNPVVDSRNYGSYHFQCTIFHLDHCWVEGYHQ